MNPALVVVKGKRARGGEAAHARIAPNVDNSEGDTMRIPYRCREIEKRHAVAALVALVLLATAAATWLWAHAGHAPLPTKGAQVDVAKGQVILSAEARDTLDVRTAEVGLRSVQESIFAYAVLVTPWGQHAYVSARLSGRIDKLHVQPGQTVAAGQVLAEVESLELKNLQLEAVNACNELRLSAKTLEQLEQASQGGGVARQRLMEARTKHQQDVETLQIARGKWLSLGLGGEEFDKLTRERDFQLLPSLPIRSPISGVVIHADLSVGKVVEAAEHLFEIVDPSAVWVRIGILEQDLHWIEPGQPVKLRLAAYPDQEFDSKVWVKEPSLDPRTHLGTVWAKLANLPGDEPRLLPGMNGLARVVVSDSKEKPAVPADALITEGAERYVLVEETATAAASQYQKQNVVIGRRAPDFVEILSGNVYPGDRVVTRGSHELAGFFVQGVLRLSPEAAKNIGLRVEPVGRHVVEEVVELEGTVDVPPDRRAAVSSQLAGTLHRIHVEPGQVVRAGDVLGAVASLEWHNLQLDLLRADLDSRLQKDAVRRVRAAGAGLPGRQLQEAENLHQAALNRREALIQKLEAIGLTAGQVEQLLRDKQLVEVVPVRAPIGGTVIQFNKVLGQTVKAGEPLFEVHDLARVWVQGYLFERDVARVHAGQSVRVRLVADPHFLAAGVVARSARTFGALDRTLSMWVELQKAPARPLPYNLLARLTVTLGRPRPVLAVPAEALVQDGLRSSVFVRKPDETFERRPVETGRADDRYVEITRGLEMGERIAVRGTAGLRTAYASLR
jgi:RND family efflux transporter MFP subunit